MRPHPPLASFRKIQGLPISKIVRTADSTIIIITNFYLAAIAPTKLGFLVTKPLTRYDKLFGAKGGHVTQHEATSYHKNATLRAAAFCDMMSKSTSVVKVLDRAHELQAKENRKRLEPIVKTIILCGRQNIAFVATGTMESSFQPRGKRQLMMEEAMTLTPQSHNSLTLKLTKMETSEHVCNFAQTLVSCSCSGISAQLAIMPLISVKLLKMT